MSAIPEGFIKRQVDALLSAARDMPEGGFKQAVMMRAQYYMDLVQAWRDSQRDTSTSSAAPHDHYCPQCKMPIDGHHTLFGCDPRSGGA